MFEEFSAGLVASPGARMTFEGVSETYMTVFAKTFFIVFNNFVLDPDQIRTQQQRSGS
jgi:hypothetical protein